MREFFNKYFNEVLSIAQFSNFRYLMKRGVVTVGILL